MAKLHHRKNFARCQNCGSGKDISEVIEEAEKRGGIEMKEEILLAAKILGKNTEGKDIAKALEYLITPRQELTEEEK